MTGSHSHPNEEDLPEEEEDLVAYLDGELDDAISATIERDLAQDAEERRKAEELEKTYDLLDYLPQPEPKADFTQRTLTKLNPVMATVSGSESALNVPSSSQMLPHPGPTRWEWLGWAFAFLIALSAGYFAHAVAAPYLNPPVEDELALSDLPVIERLPYYWGVDDPEFLQLLQESQVFSAGTVANVGPVEAPELEWRVVAADRNQLIELFKNCSLTRQQQLRDLHAHIQQLPQQEQLQTMQLLEQYASWLNRLSKEDRQEILAAVSARERLQAIRQVRERLWRASLPEKFRNRLDRTANKEELIELTMLYEKLEQTRHHEWDLAQRQWKRLTGTNQKPWPFNDPILAKNVEEYVFNCFGVDLSKPMPEPRNKLNLAAPCRLNRDEYIELHLRHQAAQQDGYWLSYGACLLRLAELHPMLPKPPKSPPILSFSDLPTAYRKVVPKESTTAKVRWQNFQGRWPDFALEVAKSARLDARLASLGPCRPGEFSEELEKLSQEQLMPLLSAQEKKRLQALEGKWPDYPKKWVELALSKNLSIPGITLPGEPKLWDEYYRLPSGQR